MRTAYLKTETLNPPGGVGMRDENPRLVRVRSLPEGVQGRVTGSRVVGIKTVDFQLSGVQGLGHGVC